MASPAQLTVSQETAEDRLAHVLDCYLWAVINVAESLTVISPEIGEAYSKRLFRWPQRLGFKLTGRVLDESRLALRSEMRGFSEVVGQHIRDVFGKAQTSNLRVATASKLLDELTAAHCRLIDTLAEEVDSGADLDSAERFRKMVRQQMIGLRASSQTLLCGVNELLKQMMEAAGNLQSSLENPEYLGEVDELTGLLSRKAARRQLETYLENGKPFSVLVFKVEGYEQIPAGQSGPLMKRLAERLVELIRPVDVASRWSEDRFFLIFHSGKAEAEARARQISVGMSDSYSRSGTRKKEHIPVTPAFTILYWESNRGMDIWDMIARIDQA